MSIFSKAHSLKIVKDANGVPTGISDVSDKIADVAIGAVVANVDDATVVTGYGRVLQVGVASYATRQVENLVKGGELALNPYK